MKIYYVYILGNQSGTLYIGMTNDLLRRVFEHKSKTAKGFAKKYNVDRLLYFEETRNVNLAIEREKEIKGWLRKKKLDLIRTMNPNFSDLSADWNQAE